MTVNPADLAPDTPVQILGGDLLLAHQVKVSRIVRVGEWLPTDEQEVPRDKWATITPGSKVRIEFISGDILTRTFDARVGPWVLDTEEGMFSEGSVARVWVLDEPDPDADLIERMAGTIGGKFSCSGEPVVSNVYRDVARAVLAVVREDGAR